MTVENNTVIAITQRETATKKTGHRISLLTN